MVHDMSSAMVTTDVLAVTSSSERRGVSAIGPAEMDYGLMEFGGPPGPSNRRDSTSPHSPLLKFHRKILEKIWRRTPLPPPRASWRAARRAWRSRTRSRAPTGRLARVLMKQK